MDEGRVGPGSRGALVALVTPLAAAVLALGTTAVIESRGVRIFSEYEPRNLAEAAAAARAYDVVRFLVIDPNPTRVYDVRPFFISPEVTRVIALEAAVWSRQPALVELLEGTAVADDQWRTHIACLATDLRALDVARRVAPDGAQCVPGSAFNAIVGRR